MVDLSRQTDLLVELSFSTFTVHTLANKSLIAFKSLTGKNQVMKALLFCNQITVYVLLANSGKSDMIKESLPIWLETVVLKEKKMESSLEKDPLVPNVHYKKKALGTLKTNAARPRS